MSTAWLFEQDKVEDYAWWDNFLTHDECDEVVKIGKEKKLKKGTTRKNIDINYRISDISFIYPNQKNNWLFDKLAGAINELNNKFFKFDLYGFTEGAQFTNYKFPKGHYGKHIDKSFSFQIRKLSMVIQLSDPKEYKGGDLCLYYKEKPTIIEKQKGKLVVFPSYVLHEVTPLTYGERNSLVTWLSGPNFK